MAPTKEKKEKLTADEGADLVLDYLRKQNRPYSVVDISSNLLNKVSKTKYLKELHDKKLIESRVSGKQLVYHALQAAPSEEGAAEADLMTLDDCIADLRAKVTTLKTTEKTLKAELVTLNSIRSLDEVQSMVHALETQKIGLQERLSHFKSLSADAKPVTEEDRRVTEERFNSWKREANLRKEAIKSLWTIVADLPRTDEASAEDLWESVGCEGHIP